jgi:putative sigma-54 modulation protein
MEQVTVIAPDSFINQETRIKIQKVVSRALDRFNGVIKAVEVKFLDENGPKGGVDKMCTLKVTNNQSGKVIIKSKGISFLQAAHVASGIARNALSRRQDRKKDHRAKNAKIFQVNEE